MQRMEKQGHWKQVIRNWKESGQSQKKFCLQRDIPYSVFRYWRSKMDDHVPTGMPLDPIRAVEIGRVPDHSSTVRFLEMETRGISLSVSGSDATVTINGRINLGRLERIIVACNRHDDGISDHAQA